MKVLIEITENNYKEMCEHGIERVDFDIQRMMKNAIVIPDNATNLDVFTAIFKGTPDTSICPIFCISKDDVKCQCDVDTCACGDWWDAPYKGGK